ncbi:hypothetical protein VKS41_002083 [Umbelopsis sp. WA50703]
MSTKPTLKGLPGSDKIKSKDRVLLTLSYDVLDLPFKDWPVIAQVVGSVPATSLKQYDATAYFRKFMTGLHKISKSSNRRLAMYATNNIAYYLIKSNRVAFEEVYTDAKNKLDLHQLEARKNALKRKVLLQGEENASMAALVGGKKLRRELSDDLTTSALGDDDDNDNANDNDESTRTNAGGSPRLVTKTTMANPFVPAEPRTPSPTKVDIQIKQKLFTINAPHYGLFSPNKAKVTDEQQSKLSTIVDIVMANNKVSNISEDLVDETLGIREAQRTNASLAAIPTAKRFLISALNCDFDDFLKFIWLFEISGEQVPDFEKKFILAMKYTLTEFHSKSRADLPTDHERTFFISHIIYPFSYFGHQTSLLRFYWCEKSMRHRDLSHIDSSNWSKAEARFADGLGLQSKHEFLIVEASSNGDDENLTHSIDDTVKQLDSTTGALKSLIMHHLSANFDTLKRLSVLGIQCIANKITLSATSLNEAHRYKCMELRSAEVPTSWDGRKKWFKVFELMATLQTVLLEQMRVLDELENEVNGLVEVEQSSCARQVLNL